MAEVYVRFSSLAHSDHYAYAYDSSAWKRDNGNIECKFRMYETYGHGLTAHSPDWSITYEYLGDYLASLAAYMLEHRDEEMKTGLFREIGYIVLDRPRLDVIEFAASIIWKESDGEYGKRRYYSIKEQKITKNREKEHDKRYSKVERCDDGSAEAILRMILPEYCDGMERLCYAWAIKEWFDGQKSRWCETPAAILGWWKEDQDNHNKKAILRYGFEAIRQVAKMYESEMYARNHLENYEINHLKKAEEQKQLPAETEAA